MVEVDHDETQGGVLDGILWILKTEAQWNHLPPMYLSYHTCRRSGVLQKILIVAGTGNNAEGGRGVG